MLQLETISQFANIVTGDCICVYCVFVYVFLFHLYLYMYVFNINIFKAFDMKFILNPKLCLCCCWFIQIPRSDKLLKCLSWLWTVCHRINCTSIQPPSTFLHICHRICRLICQRISHRICRLICQFNSISKYTKGFALFKSLDFFHLNGPQLITVTDGSLKPSYASNCYLDISSFEFGIYLLVFACICICIWSWIVLKLPFWYLFVLILYLRLQIWSIAFVFCIFEYLIICILIFVFLYLYISLFDHLHFLSERAPSNLIIPTVRLFNQLIIQRLSRLESSINASQRWIFWHLIFSRDACLHWHLIFALSAELSCVHIKIHFLSSLKSWEIYLQIFKLISDMSNSVHIFSISWHVPSLEVAVLSCQLRIGSIAICIEMYNVQ